MHCHIAISCNEKINFKLILLRSLYSPDSALFLIFLILLLVPKLKNLAWWVKMLIKSGFYHCHKRVFFKFNKSYFLDDMKIIENLIMLKNKIDFFSKKKKLFLFAEKLLRI